MNVILAEDSDLLRESLAGALEQRGIRVVGLASNAADLVATVDAGAADIAIVDIRMPPGYSTEGLEATRRIREQHPSFPVLLLSHHVESAMVLELLRDDPRGLGYLLKDRVTRLDELVAALDRLVAGGSIVDAEVVTGLIGRKRPHGPLDELTPREREVLGLMAEGRSNRGIASALAIEEKTVEYHVGQVFGKLQLEAEPHGHRRVLAVLAWLSREGHAPYHG